MQLVCPHCSAINRLPVDKPAQAAKCGKCSKSLFGQMPVNVNQAQFDRHLHKSDVPLVVDFWADWCGPCKMMAPAFQQAATKIEPRARLLKVNTEQEQGLSARYAIRSIPTLMVFSAGQEVARMSGALDLGNLLSWINNHI
ncbi:MAG: thioredoxin TrxC [Gammaproteobacteria bacterium]|nr:thioredoxin TrxC [Gammaproteobacteria bacterium]